MRYRQIDNRVIAPFFPQGSVSMAEQLMLTWKQVEKYTALCSRYGNSVSLDSLNYALVHEETAQPLERWYGAGEEYIVIMPSGEHFHHDDYLLFDISRWLRGFYPRARRKKKKKT